MVNRITILKYKMHPTGRNDKLLVRDVNPHLLCVLCRGYFVEATSIVECLHSFCKSCIVKFIKTSRYCPICDVQLNRQDPLLSLKPDKILQRLCFKIVPGLYKSEKLRRKDFSTRHNEDIASEFSATYNQFFSFEDNISISLEYYDNNSQSLRDHEIKKDAWTGPDKEKTLRKYLQCPAAVTINHLKKIVRLKYGLPSQQRVDILYNHESLEDEFKLMDVAYTFDWSRVEPMRFGYVIFKQYSITVKEPNKVTVVNISSAHQKTDNTSKEGTISPKTNNTPNFNNNQVTTKDKYYTANAPKRKFDKDAEEADVEPVNKMCKQIEISKDINENIDTVKLPETKVEERVVDFEEEMEEEEDYSKYEQDIEEVTDDDASDKLRISSAPSEDDLTEHNSVSPDRTVQEEKSVTKSHHYYNEEYKPKKKSKKEKRHHHHHHHHRHYDRKKPLEATILQSDDTNDLKLKVKLNVSKSSYYSYKKSKSSDSGSSPKQLPSDDDSNSTKSHKSDESRSSKERKSSSSASKVVSNSPNGDNSGGEEKTNIPPSTKEKLLQMRAVRHKTISKEPKETSEDRTTLLLAQSSITVSKITASEKIQLEKNKMNMANNEVPSLQIMLVKGPTPKSVSDLNKPGNVNAGLDLQRVPNGTSTSNSLLSKINKISSQLHSENKSSKSSPVRRPSSSSSTTKEKSIEEKKSAEREAKLLDYVGALDLSRRPPNMPISSVPSNEKSLGTVQNGTWVQKQMNGKRPVANTTASPSPKTDVLKSMGNSKPISQPVNKYSPSSDQKNSSMNPMKKVQTNYQKKPVQPSYVPSSPSNNVAGDKTVIPQPIKIPPTTNIPNKLLMSKNVPKMNPPVSHMPPRKNGIPMDAHSKPGMNQAVRHIPNPSALFYRNQVPVPTNTVEKKFKNGIPPMPAAIPISALTSLKRIENMAKTFDKGTHGLMKSKPEF